MPNDPESPSSALGQLLAEALARSAETSLSSLGALHNAVRAYTRNEKNRGMSLDSVMRGISSTLMEMEDERAWSDEESPRDPMLARQLRAWCSEHYTALE